MTVPAMEMRDVKGQRMGYKAQIRFMRRILAEVLEILQLIQSSGTHGYNNACVCADCSAIRGAMKGLINQGVLAEE